MRRRNHAWRRECLDGDLVPGLDKGSIAPPASSTRRGAVDGSGVPGPAFSQTSTSVVTRAPLRERSFLPLTILLQSFVSSDKNAGFGPLADIRLRRMPARCHRQSDGLPT